MNSARENRKKVEELAKQTNELLSQGMGTPVDQLRMQMQVKTAQQVISVAENNLAASVRQLNLLVGLPVSQLTQLEPVTSLPEELNVSVNYVVVLERMLSSRQDLAVLEIQENIVREQMAFTNSGRLPIVLLNGSYGYLNVHGSNFDLYNDRDWAVSFIAQWKFFDGGETLSKVDDIQSNFKKIQEKKANLKASFDVDLQSILGDFNLASTRVQTLEKQLALAKEIERIGRERYKAGYFTSFELIDCQTTLFSAQTEYINAIYDLKIVSAKVDKVVGDNF